MRLLHLEALEHRALLAALQFTAGLGEQSTLDSAAQAANYLSDVNDADSQQFTHNDGTAVSNVTLTTAASTTGNPGVNLDILSQGSVAKNGIANVSVNAGLSDASGTIGPTVNVPVTIVATEPDETVGEPVAVQFGFAFNVKTFASNNATANFIYAASYTYDGTTTSLASNEYDLGGSGITPIGSGPMDDETGTLDVRIGDTFTLSYSENLAGQTIAPFIGDGLNNVGWVVDTNLDVSIATPYPTTTSIDSGPTPSVYGQPVTFGAQVRNVSPESTAEPTGTVQFYVDGTPFNAPVEVNTDGAALITDDTLPVGDHQITADYVPEGEDFAPSSSEIPVAPGGHLR